MSRKPQYNHVRVTLTPTTPPQKSWTTPTYHLERYTIRRNIKTVNVQLHGLRGSEKRTESISFPLLPNVTDPELVRAAVFFSLNKWTVPFGLNVKQFNGKFTSPLSEQLLAALMGRPQAASPNVSQQTQNSPSAATTVANMSVSQSHYQSSIPQPGQFQHFAATNNAPLSQSSNKHSVVQWYKTRTRRMKISLGCGTLIAVLLFFSCIGSAIDSNYLALTPAPTPTSTAGQAAVISSPSATQQPSPTSQPTQQPTQKPTPLPTPKPNIAPTHAQPPHTPTPCPGINCNPWGYNFTSGNYITSPPSNFCNYFSCIASFWNGHGYVEECQDATYSLSGGIQGSCSNHGGNLRPLYAH